ncbi:YihY/virulence factor BrkB family protein [Phenylobacterium sp. LH3H17]|uniref:YihY/virulence factor BrkB family protein n=1 Tax=Phenylobacterium sp. LH3H17 TaxID=2903901 RepID=UPI0020C99898|nr:YihY/virulence factor BrkB family protein [Phenylobacterium sp. LH3H17]UTP40661.1 YihY/virulence factor BrkB family protein [Phenylobacterium sp. LH3H17]
MDSRTALGRVGKRVGSLAFKVAPWIALAAMTELWRRRGAPRLPGMSVEATAAPHAFDAAEPGRGRLAHGPHHIPPRGWKDIAWRTYQEIGRDRLPAVAGGVTFYTLLALFPAIGVFVSLYGIFADLGAVQQQLNEMATVFPREVVSIVGDQMVRLALRPPASLSVAFVVSLLFSVWTANAGMKALFHGLNIAYDEVENRNVIRLTLLTYGFTFAALVFLVVMTAILVAVPLAFERLGLGGVATVWIPLRWLALLTIAGAAFSIVYRYAPCRARARWRWVSLGGILAACLWLGGSLGFSWYVNNIAHFDATYGSLGAAIGFMMWIWFSVMVVLIGAELNAEIEHQTARDSTTGPEQPMGARGAAMADTVGLAFHFNASKIASRAWTDGQRQAERVRKALRRQPNSSSKAANRAA